MKKLVILICGVVLAGCERQPEVVTYKLAYPADHVTKPRPPPLQPGASSDELPPGHPPIGPAPAAAGGIVAETGAAEYGWTLPASWQAAPVSPGGMRLASFATPSVADAGPGDCSIVKLSGAAGGLAGNINRWRGQLGLQPASEEEILQQVSRSRTDTDMEVIGIELQSAADAEAPQAMLAAMVADGGSTVFIKLAGPQASVLAARDDFAALLRSFHRHDDHQ